MNEFRSVSRRCAVFYAGSVLALMAAPLSAFAGAPISAESSAKTARDELPSFAAIRGVVTATVARDRHYRPGDLLSRSQVTNVLKALKSNGWEVGQARELLGRVPADDEFLVRALRSPKGIGLMRRIAVMNGGYDRLDRLSRIPNGQQIVHQLIEGPDGYKLIGYMTDSRGGKELGKMLGRTAQDGDLNKPTGRIYTEKQLLSVLEKVHAAEKVRK